MVTRFDDVIRCRKKQAPAGRGFGQRSGEPGLAAQRSGHAGLCCCKNERAYSTLMLTVDRLRGPFTEKATSPSTNANRV